MKLALIGATGFVGTKVLNELISRGHKVTAIARNTDTLPHHENVTAKQVDVFDTDATAEAIKGHDAVISAYNPGWTNPNIYNDSLKGSAAILESTKKADLKRILVIGGAGSLYIAEGVQLVDSPEFPAEWKSGAQASRDFLNTLKKEQDLEWTFLSPAIEMHQGTSGERKGKYRSGLENPVFNEEGRSVISAEDLAVAIADEIENPNHIRRRFTVAY